MSPKKAKPKMQIPPYLTAPQVASMLNLDNSAITRRVNKGKYPGAFKPGGKKTTTILIPSSYFPAEEVEAFLIREEKERGQSVN